jgi:hypothetical protein
MQFLKGKPRPINRNIKLLWTRFYRKYILSFTNASASTKRLIWFKFLGFKLYSKNFFFLLKRRKQWLSFFFSFTVFNYKIKNAMAANNDKLNIFYLLHNNAFLCFYYKKPFIYSPSVVKKYNLNVFLYKKYSMFWSKKMHPWWRFHKNKFFYRGKFKLKRRKLFLWRRKHNFIMFNRYKLNLRLFVVKKFYSGLYNKKHTVYNINTLWLNPRRLLLYMYGSGGFYFRLQKRLLSRRKRFKWFRFFFLKNKYIKAKFNRIKILRPVFNKFRMFGFLKYNVMAYMFFIYKLKHYLFFIRNFLHWVLFRMDYTVARQTNVWRRALFFKRLYNIRKTRIVVPIRFFKKRFLRFSWLLKKTFISRPLTVVLRKKIPSKYTISLRVKKSFAYLLSRFLRNFRKNIYKRKWKRINAVKNVSALSIRILPWSKFNTHLFSTVFSNIQVKKKHYVRFLKKRKKRKKNLRKFYRKAVDFFNRRLSYNLKFLQHPVPMLDFLKILIIKDKFFFKYNWRYFFNLKIFFKNFLVLDNDLMLIAIFLSSLKSTFQYDRHFFTPLLVESKRWFEGVNSKLYHYFKHYKVNKRLPVSFIWLRFSTLLLCFIKLYYKLMRFRLYFYNFYFSASRMITKRLLELNNSLRHNTRIFAANRLYKELNRRSLTVYKFRQLVRVLSITLQKQHFVFFPIKLNSNLNKKVIYVFYKIRKIGYIFNKNYRFKFFLKKWAAKLSFMYDSLFLYRSLLFLKARFYKNSIFLRKNVNIFFRNRRSVFIKRLIKRYCRSGFLYKFYIKNIFILHQINFLWLAYFLYIQGNSKFVYMQTIINKSFNYVNSLLLRKNKFLFFYVIFKIFVNKIFHYNLVKSSSLQESLLKSELFYFRYFSVLKRYKRFIVKRRLFFIKNLFFNRIRRSFFLPTYSALSVLKKKSAIIQLSLTTKIVNFDRNRMLALFVFRLFFKHKFNFLNSNLIFSKHLTHFLIRLTKTNLFSIYMCVSTFFERKDMFYSFISLYDINFLFMSARFILFRQFMKITSLSFKFRSLYKIRMSSFWNLYNLQHIYIRRLKQRKLNIIMKNFRFNKSFLLFIKTFKNKEFLWRFYNACFFRLKKKLKKNGRRISLLFKPYSKKKLQNYNNRNVFFHTLSLFSFFNWVGYKKIIFSEILCFYLCSIKYFSLLHLFCWLSFFFVYTFSMIWAFFFNFKLIKSAPFLFKDQKKLQKQWFFLELDSRVIKEGNWSKKKTGRKFRRRVHFNTKKLFPEARTYIFDTRKKGFTVDITNSFLAFYRYKYQRKFSSKKLLTFLYRTFNNNLIFLFSKVPFISLFRVRYNKFLFMINKWYRFLLKTKKYRIGFSAYKKIWSIYRFCTFKKRRNKLYLNSKILVFLRKRFRMLRRFVRRARGLSRSYRYLYDPVFISPSKKKKSTFFLFTLFKNKRWSICLDNKTSRFFFNESKFKRFAYKLKRFKKLKVISLLQSNHSGVRRRRSVFKYKKHVFKVLEIYFNKHIKRFKFLSKKSHVDFEVVASMYYNSLAFLIYRLGFIGTISASISAIKKHWFCLDFKPVSYYTCLIAFSSIVTLYPSLFIFSSFVWYKRFFIRQTFRSSISSKHFLVAKQPFFVFAFRKKYKVQCIYNKFEFLKPFVLKNLKML